MFISKSVIYLFNINKQKHIMNTLEINWKDGTTTKLVNDKVVTQKTKRTFEENLELYKNFI